MIKAIVLVLCFTLASFGQTAAGYLYYSGSTIPAASAFPAGTGILAYSSNGSCSGTGTVTETCVTNGTSWTHQSAGGLTTVTQTGTGAPPRNIVDKLNDFVNAEDYGAVSDGNTDNAPAITKGIAALKPGQTLYFPCTNSAGVYKVSTAINFGGMANQGLRGPGQGCSIQYNGSTASNYAFSFVGAESLSVDNLDFAVIFGTAPKTILLLGRASGGTQSGVHKFTNVKVEGNCTQAVVYSIASEENVWINPTFILNGGGASYVFYTGVNDDLSVASLPSSTSNLSLWMQNFHILDFSSASTHTLIADADLSSAGGDHTYRDGYMYSSGGTGVVFRDKDGSSGIGNFSTVFSTTRFEGGTVFFQLDGASGTTVSYLQLTGNRISSGSGTKVVNASSGVALSNSILMGNIADNGETSTLGAVSNSTISEYYPVTITTGTNLNWFVPSTGSLSATSFQLGQGGPTWTRNTGAPSGSCGNGSFYSRTDAPGGFYACQSGAWVSK